MASGLRGLKGYRAGQLSTVEAGRSSIESSFFGEPGPVAGAHQDDFNRPDGPLGNRWGGIGWPLPRVLSRRAAHFRNVGDHWGDSAAVLTTWTPPSPDYDVEADIARSVGTGRHEAGVLGRGADNFNGYLFRWSNGWQIYKIVNGTYTQLGPTVVDQAWDGLKPADSGGVPRRLKGRMRGSVLQLEVDGVVLLEVTDTDHTAPGRAGIWYAGNNPFLTLDSFAAAATGEIQARTGQSTTAGGGTLTAAGAKAGRGAIVVTGGGTLASTGRKGAAGGNSVTGGGTATVTGAKAGRSSATVTGGGELTAASGRSGQGAAVVTGGGAPSFFAGTTLDDFNRPDGPLGSRWLPVNINTSTWWVPVIKAGKLVSGTDSVTRVDGMATFQEWIPPSPDYEVSALVERTTLTGQEIGVVVRGAGDGTRNGYLFRWSHGFEIFRLVDGAYTKLADDNQTISPHGLPANTPRKLTGRIQGSKLTLLVDDVVALQVTDSTFSAAGRAGVWTAAFNTNLSLDDLRFSPVAVRNALAVSGGGQTVLTGSATVALDVHSLYVAGGGQTDVAGRKAIERSASATGGGSAAAVGGKSARRATSVTGGGSGTATGRKTARRVLEVAGGGSTSSRSRKTARRALEVAGGGGMRLVGVPTRPGPARSEPAGFLTWVHVGPSTGGIVGSFAPSTTATIGIPVTRVDVELPDTAAATNTPATDVGVAYEPATARLGG